MFDSFADWNRLKFTFAPIRIGSAASPFPIRVLRFGPRAAASRTPHRLTNGVVYVNAARDSFAAGTAKYCVHSSTSSRLSNAPECVIIARSFPSFGISHRAVGALQFSKKLPKPRDTHLGTAHFCSVGTRIESHQCRTADILTQFRSKWTGENAGPRLTRRT